MRVIALASIKGAPGVTTMACLIGASWPSSRPVMVVESDLSGCDLAARYRLSAKSGWTSFVAASRRADTPQSIEPHLQFLPGGLPVLVGKAPAEGSDPSWPVVPFLECASREPSGPRDTVVDLGRLALGRRHAREWVGHAQITVLLVRGDAASLVHVRERAGEILALTSGQLGLVIAGSSDYDDDEITRFTSMQVLGHLPFDPDAASLVSEGRGNRRRLARSPLIASTTRLACLLSGEATATATATGTATATATATGGEGDDDGETRPPSRGDPRWASYPLRTARRIARVAGAEVSQIEKTGLAEAAAAQGSLEIEYQTEEVSR